MQRRIESIKLENINEEETNSKIAKVEEECVSIHFINNFVQS